MPDLDKVASDVVNHQRDSLVQRKDLAQKTKDFRKLEDAAKLSEIKGLLKGTRFDCFAPEWDLIWTFYSISRVY